MGYQAVYIALGDEGHLNLLVGCLWVRYGMFRTIPAMPVHRLVGLVVSECLCYIRTAEKRVAVLGKGTPFYRTPLFCFRLQGIMRRLIRNCANCYN